jgi:hypothetical protein
VQALVISELHEPHLAILVTTSERSIINPVAKHPFNPEKIINMCLLSTGNKAKERQVT